jgi:uncharacterized membrane protein YcaP (DUF421 family)
MAFGLAVLLLATFVVNVALGAVSGDPILGNVTEMLLLLAAAIAFVAGILKREAADNAKKQD